MIKNISYDTICHEHLEYYSLKSVKYLLDKVGFSIIDIELNSINGGSFALTVAKKKSAFKVNTKLIEWLLYKENLLQSNKLATFKNFFKYALMQKKLLKNLLSNLKDMKKRVIGYGASTKGNVLLQYFDIDDRYIDFIADRNPKKSNCYTPGTNIKIISESKSRSLNPDYYLVLPWHFKKEILQREKIIRKRGTKFIFPLPIPKII